jgi:DNA repair and recombination protein RAD52
MNLEVSIKYYEIGSLLTVSDFDEADFSVPNPDVHPDEVVLPEPVVASHHSSGIRNSNLTSGVTQHQDKQPVNRQQLARQPNGLQSGNISGNIPPQPQTPNSGFARSTSGAGQMRPPQDSGPPRPAQPAQQAQSAQFVVAGKVMYQPSRTGTGPPSAPPSPAHLDNGSSDNDNALPPQGAGFFSARAAARIPEGSTEEPLPPQTLNLPAFNPHADSPSIRKTPGVDRTMTKPLTRDLKHVPGSTQAVADTTGAGIRGNVVNPQLNVARRIGAPGAGNLSPMANRGSYKPPTLKRLVDGGGVNRAPLGDVPANGAIAHGDGGDSKRQRLNG